MSVKNLASFVTGSLVAVSITLADTTGIDPYSESTRHRDDTSKQAATFAKKTASQSSTGIHRERTATTFSNATLQARGPFLSAAYWTSSDVANLLCASPRELDPMVTEVQSRPVQSIHVSGNPNQSRDHVVDASSLISNCSGNSSLAQPKTYIL